MNRQIIDEDTKNEEIIENMEGDFDTFLRDRDFRNAQEIIDNLCDIGKYTKAGELLIKLAAAKMTVPADFGEKELTPFPDSEYDKYSTREYYDAVEKDLW